MAVLLGIAILGRAEDSGARDGCVGDDQAQGRAGAAYTSISSLTVPISIAAARAKGGGGLTGSSRVALDAAERHPARFVGRLNGRALAGNPRVVAGAGRLKARCNQRVTQA